jgi:hypothetical protein
MANDEVTDTGGLLSLPDTADHHGGFSAGIVRYTQFAS